MRWLGRDMRARLRAASSGWTGYAIVHDRSRKFISDFPGGTEIRERRKIDLPSDLLPRTNKANIERGPRHSTERPIGRAVSRTSSNPYFTKAAQP